MLATFPAPVLSVTPDAVRDLQGRDALSGLWTRESFPFPFGCFLVIVLMHCVSIYSVYEM